MNDHLFDKNQLDCTKLVAMELKFAFVPCLKCERYVRIVLHSDKIFTKEEFYYEKDCSVSYDEYMIRKIIE